METIYHYSYDFDTSGWDSINTFDDAIDLNIEFLEGKRKSTPYHGAPIYDVDVSKLLFIHEKGRIITTSGQSNECIYDIFFPEKRHIYLHNDRIEYKRITPAEIISSEQKSYLEGFIERKQFHSFMSFLKHNKLNIAYHVYDIINDKSYYNGYDKKSRWVTRVKINDLEWQETTWISKEPNLHSVYDNFLSRTRTPLIYFIIFAIKPCELNMEDILIAYIDQKNKHKKSKKKTSKKKKKNINKRPSMINNRRSLKKS